MRPDRPGSAKSQLTRKTLDSDQPPTELGISKFSETFTSGVQQKQPMSFQQYVAEKDKDPRFTKYQKKDSNSIPQAQQGVKPTKPFLKSKAKIEKPLPKIELVNSKVEEQPSQLGQSKGFAERNKQKMNSLRISHQTEEGTVKPKPKINMEAFTVNQPVKKSTADIAKQELAPAQKKALETRNTTEAVKSPRRQQLPKMDEEQLSRMRQLSSIQSYLQGIEDRELEMFQDGHLATNGTNGYHGENNIAVEASIGMANEVDYQKVAKEIREMDDRLNRQDTQVKLGQSSVSVDNLMNAQQKSIQDEIDNETTDKQQQTGQIGNEQQSEQFLSQISSADLKLRNLFLTEILKGRVTRSSIEQLSRMDSSAIKLKKLQIEKEQRQDEEDESVTQINMMMKKSHRLLERNRIEAAGEIHRDCDYLSAENQTRLEQLMTASLEPSPFELCDLEVYRNRRIDEGIRMYRGKILQEQTLLQDSLPKDPVLRQEAQRKILKEKMSSINERLLAIERSTVTKAKIKSVLQQLRDTPLSESGAGLIQSRQLLFEQQSRQLHEAEKILQTLMKEKEQVLQAIQDIDNSLKKVESEAKRVQQMSVKELQVQLQQEMKQSLQRVSELSQQTEQCQQQIEQYEEYTRELRERIQLLANIESMQSERIMCPNVSENETVESLDAMISRKYNLKDTREQQGSS